MRSWTTSLGTAAQMASVHHLPPHLHYKPGWCALLLSSLQTASLSTAPCRLARSLMTNRSGCIAVAAGPSRCEVAPHIPLRLRLQIDTSRPHSYQFQLAAERSRRTLRCVRLSSVKNSLPQTLTHTPNDYSFWNFFVPRRSGFPMGGALLPARASTNCGTTGLRSLGDSLPARKPSNERAGSRPRFA